MHIVVRVSQGFFTAPIFYGGKLYCENMGQCFLVLSPFPQPAIQWLKMEKKQLRFTAFLEFLVESDGEILAVVAITGQMQHTRIKEFQVFKADLSKNTWVPVKSLDDRVLVVSEDCSVCLSAAEVGGRRNVIYFSLPSPSIASDEWCCSMWEQFDLETGRMIDKAHPKTAIKDKRFQKNTTYLMMPNLEP